MSTNAVLPKETTPDLRAKAETALDLKKKIQGLEGMLDPLLAEFRAFCGANGNTGFTLEVAGKGKVSVARGTPGREKTELQLDESAFSALDPKLRGELAARGVVKTVITVTRPREPRVTLTLNV